MIVAINNLNGIGHEGKIPWHDKEDLRYFNYMTSKCPHGKNALIVGRKTYESMPKLGSSRKMFVVSGSRTLEMALKDAKEDPEIYEIFVIGGKSIYDQAEKFPELANLYITRIDDNTHCDRIYVPNLNSFNCLKGGKYQHWIRNSAYGEQGYLLLLREVLENGTHFEGRNGPTVSLFGRHLEFNLLDGFPLLTTKRMFWRGIAEELLFFIRGETNSKLLEKKGINIWKANTSKSFLKARGLDYEEGEMGPMYGYQWRHYGNSNFDQLADVVAKLRNDSGSRRILMTTFNPADVERSVLAPCHGIVTQFNVDGKYLDLIMYQRSADAFLGLPFNIASYSLLLMIVAHATGYHARRVRIDIGNVHIYKEHMDACKIQIARIPRNLPFCRILCDPKEVDEYTFADFELVDYDYCKPIKAKMIA